MDITTKPIEELVEDLAESQEDIMRCTLALGLGITTYGDSSELIVDRLATNQKIVDIIKTELIRRKQ